MPGQRRGRRQIEALACLRVATPPAESTPTHDSIRATRKFSRRRGLGFCCIKNAETAAERKVSLVFQTASPLRTVSLEMEAAGHLYQVSSPFPFPRW